MLWIKARENSHMYGKRNEQGSTPESLSHTHTHTQTQSVNKATVNYNGLAQKPYPMVQFNREKSIPPSLNNFTPQCIRDMEKREGLWSE